MEDLIMKIIDIESKAQEVICDAKKADSELDARIKNDTRKLQEDITKKAEAKNASLRRLEEEDADKKIEEITAETKKHMDSLEAKYNANKEKWVNEIVSGIIGR